MASERVVPRFCGSGSGSGIVAMLRVRPQSLCDGSHTTAKGVDVNAASHTVQATSPHASFSPD
jgi:hypothetical protein